MKSKPIFWIVVIAAAGLSVWLVSRPQEKAGYKAVKQIGGQKTQPAKQFHPVQPVQVTEASRARLSPGIQPLFLPGANYADRSAAVRTITMSSTDADIDALYSYLLTKNPADDDQIEQVLKNDLMNELCALKPPPVQFADTLAQLYHDRSQNEVIRDYAVQHLATFYGEMSTASDDLKRTRSFETGEAASVLWDALSETDDSIAGTALLGLSRLGQSHTDIDAKQVAEAALKLAEDNQAGELSRITALQVCAKLNVPAALPLALSAAQPSQTIPLRISAVGALGVLGGAEQVNFLESLIQSGDERLKLPAQHALDRINQRFRLAATSH